ncbi:mitotic spindle checkpoint protein MAD2 [Carex littledalei]|uniref:Mitotic spindle checkpoint protein MAD2 n=1 Tax=Carex littledalei TaxID=544730 RepID=A0A833W324_9POAL|nr:mitotic spindle checkpoint protein MAD2 [Carex littledalei]
MASRTVSKDIITLRGSAAIVSEFFGFKYFILINTNTTEASSNEQIKHSTDKRQVMQQTGENNTLHIPISDYSEEWLEAGNLQRVVLVIMSKATSEVLERWNFNIETDAEVVEKRIIKEKCDKEIMREIQAIMRQIASCITYLPCLDEACVFDVLAYTDKDTTVPIAWLESDAKLINNPQMVKLHSFDTKIHKVDPFVSYKNDEREDEEEEEEQVFYKT